MSNYDDDLTVKRISGDKPETPEIEFETTNSTTPTANEQAEQVLEYHAWNYDDTKVVTDKGAHKTVSDKEGSKKDLKTRAAAKTAAGKKVEESVHTLLVLLRNSPDNFANFFARQAVNKNYKLPNEKLKEILEAILASILTKDGVVRLDKAPILSSQIIMQMVIQLFLKGGNPLDPAQIDKIFDFLIEATDVNPAFKETPQAKNMILLNNSIKMAKERYRETHGKEIEVGHRIIGVAASLVDEKISDRETAVVLSDLKQLISSPQDIMQVYQHYKKLGYSYEMILKEFSTMFKYLGTGLKDVRKENPEIRELMRTVRLLQTIINLYNFFKKRDDFVNKQFKAVEQDAA